MKGTAYVNKKEDRLFCIDIKITNELIIGDYIRFFPELDDRDNYDKPFTNDEVDNGIDLIVKMRIYSTIDGMMYYCDYAEEE